MKKGIVPVLLAGLLTAWLAAPASAAQAAQKPKKDEKQAAPTKVYIPKEVKDPMQAGLAAKQARLDVPFEIFKTLYLPAQQAIHNVFFLKIKNADLGFAPVVSAQPIDAAAAAAAPKVKATFNIFLQFLKAGEGAAPQVVKEVYVPASLEMDQSAYDPNKEEWYSVGYPLLPGAYTVAIAITSQDLKKIGIQYLDFTDPDSKSFTAALDTTPIFFLKEFVENQPVEMKTELHKGFFSYASVHITPNLDNAVGVGDNLDMFFYIFGAKPKDAGGFDLEIAFEVRQGDKTAIKYAVGNFPSPIISQPLQLKQTLETKKGEQVLTETKDLPAGSYTLVLKITDKTSGLKAEKKVDFTVK